MLKVHTRIVQEESAPVMSLTIGRICVKTAGRDAGKIAVVLSTQNKNRVLVDGQVRRKNCNILHLEPTAKTVVLEENASHETVVAALKTIGLAVVERKPKAAKQPRPRKKGKAKTPEKKTSP